MRLYVRSLALSFSGSFLAMHIFSSPQLCDILIVNTLFYCTGGFQISGSLLYPADSCSNLKECLNKICTLPCCSPSEFNLLRRSAGRSGFVYGSVVTEENRSVLLVLES